LSRVKHVVLRGSDSDVTLTVSRATITSYVIVLV